MSTLSNQKTGLLTAAISIDNLASDASYDEVVLDRLNKSLYASLADIWKNDDRDRILITVPAVREKADVYSFDTYKLQAVVLLCHPDLALVGDYVSPNDFPGHLIQSHVINRSYYELVFLSLGNRRIPAMKRVS